MIHLVSEVGGLMTSGGVWQTASLPEDALGGMNAVPLGVVYQLTRRPFLAVVFGVHEAAHAFTDLGGGV